MQNNVLNVFVYLMFSVDIINKDSNYVIVKKLCNELVKNKRFNFFIILDKNRKYYKDDLDKNINVIYVPFPKSKKEQVIHFNSNIIRQLSNKYQIDIWWNNVVEQGHHLKYFQDTYDYRWKVLNYHHYVIHDSLPSTYYATCPHIMLDQIVGSMLVDLNFFHSQWCRQMFQDEIEKVLTSQQVAKLSQSCTTLTGGYVEKQLKTAKYDQFTFIYNHRLQGYKNWKTTFEIFERLAKKHDFKVVVTGNNENMSTIVKYPFVIVKTFNSHDEYLEELAKCHANVINSQHETYCISLAESIVHDQVVVAPRRCTFPELLGDNYKYLFDNETQQEKMLDDILTNDIREIKHKTKKKLMLKNHVNNFEKLLLSLPDERENVLEHVKDRKKAKQIKNYLIKNEINFKEFKLFLHSIKLSSQAFNNTKIKLLLDQENFSYNVMLDKYVKKETKSKQN